MTARDIGVRNGGSNKGLQVISDKGLYTSGMQLADQSARQQGARLTFVKGGIEVWNEQNKRYEKQDAVWQKDKDGKIHYYVRADLIAKTPEQIFDHENFHDILDRNPQLRNRMIGYLNDNYSQEQIASLAMAYVEAYHGIYGMDEAALNDYLEEALADVYADLRRGRIDNGIVKQVLQAFSTEIDTAKNNAQTAQATRDSRGSPGQRYLAGKIDEETAQKFREPINSNDVITLRSIGRKAVTKFTTEDLKKAGKWAYKFNQELQEKSPFFRAWFGDWRSVSEAPIQIATIPAYIATNEARRANRGTFRNADTKWNIRVSREGETNTISHAGDEGLSELGLAGIQSLVENAVLLDTEVHEHHRNNAKEDWIAFNHRLYALGKNTDGTVALYRITVEDQFANPKNPSDMRFHNLKYIEKVADYIGSLTQGNKARRAETTSDVAATKYSVADVYRFVKKYDSDFNVGRSPSRVLNEDGTPRVVYHQTASDFTEFNTNYESAGKFDTETPSGMFFKTTAEDIGIDGEKQMAVYLSAKNVLEFRNREEARAYWVKNVPGYAELLQELEKRDEALKAQYEEIEAEWDRVYQENYYTDFGAGLDEIEAREDRFLEAWRKELEPIRRQMKDLVTDYMRQSPYDGMHLEFDGKMPGRPKVETYIVFEPEQIKSATDNVGTYDRRNRDIRYSASEEDTGETMADVGIGHYGSKEGGLDSSVAALPQNDRNGAEVKAEATEESFDRMAREKKEEIAARSSKGALQNRISSAEQRLQSLEQAEKVLQETGTLNRETKRDLESRKAGVRQTLEVSRAELKQRNARKRAEKARAAAQEKLELQPKLAKRDFRTDALNLFSIQAGSRQELGKVLDAFADRALAEGRVSYEDRRELLGQLYARGIEVVTPEYTSEIRQQLRGGRVYVNDTVRQEFGDDWENFRKRAWGSGIYLTTSQQDPGIDVWNQDLAEQFPGSFDAEDTDLRQMLERMVSLAEEGKAEHLSLQEMMARNQKQYGVSVEQQMDELESKLDSLIDKFAEKAAIEIETRRRGTMELVKERQYFRDMIRRESERRNENRVRGEVMQQLKQLSRMRKRSAPEIRAQIDRVLNGLDTVARSISPQGIEDLQALARVYNQAKEDPNFLPSPYVEARLGRLGQVQLDDMKISDVIELGRTIAGIVTSVQNQNRMLADERHREISAAAKQAAEEIRGSRGSRGGKLQDWLRFEHVSPTRAIEQLGGWLRGGETERLAKSLEQGGIRQLNYLMGGSKYFDSFVQDKANRKWLQTASGKKAQWIKVALPTGYTGTKNGVQVELREVELTPMMRVSLLLHAENADNLRHISGGGITIPDKVFYAAGNMANAYAKGIRVKLTPETVRGLTANATAQERAFAKALRGYFNEFSTGKINEVSMQLDGFERAGGEHYFPIETDPKFLATLPENIQKDLQLESIGFIVNERVHAQNPIVLRDASDVLTRHIETISKYYGYAVAIRDFNAVMNHVFHEEGNAFAGSMKELLAEKWGEGAQTYLDRLLGDLQQKGGVNETAEKLMSKLRGRMAGATLMLNPAVALSQLASIPGALQTVGVDGLIHGLQLWQKADMGLIEKYSPLLWYRNQGNSTQELGDYMKEQGLEKKLPWLLNWIQVMDSAAIRRLWVASEYRAQKDTGLSPGDAAGIQAGTDPYYQAVAEIFNRAVLDTQPNYTVMQRPQILRSGSDLTKFLTMYKTVPLQYYNMMYEAFGRLQADAARAKANQTDQKAQADYQKSRSFAARTVVGLLGANVTYVVIKALVKGFTKRGKKYQDEEGKYTWASALPQLGMDLTETFAGSVIGGTELLQAMESAYGSLSGKKLKYYGTEISVLSAFDDLAQNFVDLMNAIGTRSLTDGLSAIKKTALNMASVLGVPAKNAETYLLGIMKWVAPEWVARYGNLFDEVEKSDLSGVFGEDQRAALRVLMDNRTGNVSDEAVDELQRLWNNGYKTALPSALPSKFSQDGTETVLTPEQKRQYHDVWGETVDGLLGELMESEAYQQASDDLRARMIAKVYSYAGDMAQAAALGEDPEQSVRNAGDALRYLAGQDVEGDPNDAYWAARKLQGVDKYDRLHDAMDRGTDISEAVRELTEHGVKEDSVNSEISKYLKERYDKGEIDPARAERELRNYRGLDENAAYWAVKEWDGIAAHAGEEDYSFSKFDRLRETVAAGADIQDAVDELLAHGTQEKDVWSAVKDSIGTQWESGALSDTEAMEALQTYWRTKPEGGKDYAAASENEAYWAVQEWIGKREHADDPDYAWNKYDRLREAIDANLDIADAVEELTAHGVKKDSVRNWVKGYVVDKYETGEYSEKKLTEYLARYLKITRQSEVDEILTAAKCHRDTGYSYDSVYDGSLYKAGAIGRDECERILKKYAGLDEAEARRWTTVWDFQNTHDELGWSKDTTYTYFYKSPQYAKGTEYEGKSAKDMKISPAQWDAYLAGLKECTGEDKDGDGKADSGTKQAQIIALIKSLPLTLEQKIFLWYRSYGKANLWKARRAWG